MKLKLNADGSAAVQDGKPIYLADDGKEVAFDHAATMAAIGRLNGEAKGHRERAEAAEGRVKLFEGIDDPDAARKAMATVKNLDDKKLIDAGEVERIKAEAVAATKKFYEPVTAERDALSKQLAAEKIGGSFARSAFIASKLAIPADMVEAAFGRHFALKDGRVVATDTAGNVIYSDANAGEVAGFDEALSKLVQAYPHRDRIMKGTGASGGGAGPSNGTGGKKTMTRAQFEALAPMAQMAAAKEATITD